MNPDVIHGYRTASHHLHGFVDWYLLQIDIWGWGIVLAVQAGVILTAVCLLGGGCHIAGRIRDRRRARHGLRRLEQYANQPATRAALDDFHQPRKETP